MTISDAIKITNGRLIKGEICGIIKGIAEDSREVKKGEFFVAVKGCSLNGEDFVDSAIGKGAVGAMSTDRQGLSRLAAAFYNYPSKRLKVVGITGTNGKTTVSYLLESILKADSKNAGIIGTIANERNTTPSALELHRLMSEMLENGGTHCVMEVSSHGLAQERTSDVDFDTAIFTNFTRDHLDYHKDLESYFNAKKRLFDGLRQGASAVINGDDERLNAIRNTQYAIRIIKFGIENEDADFRAKDIEFSIKGSSFNVKYSGGNMRIVTRLFGRHNVYNILAAVGGAFSLGIEPKVIENGIRNFEGVPGRLESVEGGQDFKIFIDYAHTPDALGNVIKAIKQIAKGRILCVFGCGGERDKGKRGEMGRVASDSADFVIITSDNPRGEDAEGIVKEIEEGVDESSCDCRIIIDRAEAIREAIEIAEKDDVVLIAGKGHERCQIVGDEKVEFEDRKVVEEILRS